MEDKKIIKLISKNKTKNVIQIVILIVLLVVLGVFIKYDYDLYKSVNSYNDPPEEFKDKNDEISVYEQNANCIEGETKETIIKDINAKATFTCLGNIDYNEYHQFKLNNNKILLYDNLQYSPDKKPLKNIKALIFDPKTKKFSKVNDEVFIEKSFTYGGTQQLPENKQFVTPLIIYNSSNNSFYQMPDNKLEKYNSFKLENYNNFKKFSEIKHFSDMKILYGGQDFKNYDITHIWIEDPINLKRSKIGKLISNRDTIPEVLKIGKNKIMIVGGDSNNIEIYNSNTGNINLLGYTKIGNKSPSLFLIDENTAIICKNNNIEIVDLKTGKTSLHRYKNNHFKNVKNTTPSISSFREYSTFLLINKNNILFYDFIFNKSVIFNLSKKKFYEINNLKKEGVIDVFKTQSIKDIERKKIEKIFIDLCKDTSFIKLDKNLYYIFGGDCIKVKTLNNVYENKYTSAELFKFQELKK